MIIGNLDQLSFPLAIINKEKGREGTREEKVCTGLGLHSQIITEIGYLDCLPGQSFAVFLS